MDATQERFLAARCRHLHGDPHRTADESAAHRGKSDLLTRTWQAGREMSRDERRLLRRYDRTLKAQRERDLKAWHACPMCSGT